jgi:hypothetical protein
VTAVVNSSIKSKPGSSNESSFSDEASAGVGPTAASPFSAPHHDFPEQPAPFPNLPSKGCFIATAAYGFYSAPQVQALRAFRDRYLMTNAPGRAFVAWYYRHGPAGARYITDHPWLKPVVRVALLPLVLGSIFLTATPSGTKIALLALLALTFWVRKKERLREGGAA